MNEQDEQEKSHTNINQDDISDVFGFKTKKCRYINFENPLNCINFIKKIISISNIDDTISQINNSQYELHEIVKLIEKTNDKYVLEELISLIGSIDCPERIDLSLVFFKDNNFLLMNAIIIYVSLNLQSSQHQKLPEFYRNICYGYKKHAQIALDSIYSNRCWSLYNRTDDIIKYLENIITLNESLKCLEHFKVYPDTNSLNNILPEVVNKYDTGYNSLAELCHTIINLEKNNYIIPIRRFLSNIETQKYHELYLYQNIQLTSLPNKKSFKIFEGTTAILYIETMEYGEKLRSSLHSLDNGMLLILSTNQFCNHVDAVCSITLDKNSNPKENYNDYLSLDLIAVKQISGSISANQKYFGFVPSENFRETEIYLHSIKSIEENAFKNLQPQLIHHDFTQNPTDDKITFNTKYLIRDEFRDKFNDIDSNDWFENLSEEEKDQYLRVSHEQLSAIKHFAQYPLTLVNGYPGTGKTHLVHEILGLFAHINSDTPVIHVTNPDPYSKSAIESDTELSKQIIAINELMANLQRLGYKVQKFIDQTDKSVEESIIRDVNDLIIPLFGNKTSNIYRNYSIDRYAEFWIKSSCERSDKNFKKFNIDIKSCISTDYCSFKQLPPVNFLIKDDDTNEQSYDDYDDYEINKDETKAYKYDGSRVINLLIGKNIENEVQIQTHIDLIIKSLHYLIRKSNADGKSLIHLHEFIGVFLTNLEIIRNKFIEKLKIIEKQIKDISNERFCDYIKARSSIKLTTRGATLYKASIEKCGCKFMIIDDDCCNREAATLSFLPSTLTHLMMIGDFKQQRPQTNYFLRRIKNAKASYDISTFERLVLAESKCNGGDLFYLTVQHRMHPDISIILRKFFYPDLKDYKSTSDLGLGRCLSSHVNFILKDEFHETDVREHINENEAIFAFYLALFFYFRGFSPKNITIITFYTGQEIHIQTKFFELFKEMKNEIGISYIPNYDVLSYYDFDIKNIDKFQGQENDVVIVSTVRSSEIGFIDEAHKIISALSRAKKHLVVLGNRRLLLNEFKMNRKRRKTLYWPEIINFVKDQNISLNGTQFEIFAVGRFYLHFEKAFATKKLNSHLNVVIN